MMKTAFDLRYVVSTYITIESRMLRLVSYSDVRLFLFPSTNALYTDYNTIMYIKYTNIYIYISIECFYT